MASSQLLRLAGNSGWSLLVQGVKASALAVVAVLLARYLGPRDFGVFATAFSVVKIAATLSSLGLERVAVRQIVQGPAPDFVVVKHVAGLRLFGGLVAYGLALGAGALIDFSVPGVRGLVAIMGLSLLPQAAFAFDAVFQAESRLRLTALATAPALVLAAGLKLAAMLAGASMFTFAWLELLEALLVALGFVITYRTTRRRDHAAAPFSGTLRSSRLLSEGLPLLLSALAVIAYMRADLVMLGLLVNARAVGIYSAAAQLSELWSLLPVAILPAVLPSLLALRARDEPRYREALARMFGAASLTAWCIALAVTLAAPLFIGLLFGESYRPAIPILRLHIWSLPFIYLSVTQAAWDLSEDRLWLSCLRTAIGAIMNIGLNFWLIPAHGPLGAAMATLVSYSFAGVFLNAASADTRAIFWMQMRALLILPFLLDEGRRASRSRHPSC